MINISERNKAICILYGQNYNLSEIGRLLCPNSDRSWVEPAIIKAMNGVSLSDAVTSTMPNVSNLASSVTVLHGSMTKRGLVLPPIKVICKCGKEFTRNLAYIWSAMFTAKH